MKKPENYQIVQRFFSSQFDVFDRLNNILEACRYDIENTSDQSTYVLTKAVLKDLINFEAEFGEFDTDLWNYVYNIGDSRELINQRVIEEGLADHKEYFFRKIEACVTSLQEVITETRAAGHEWEDVDELLTSVEKLFDAAEEVIEIDPAQLDDPEFLRLVGKIPPQRLALIEAVAAADIIKRKPPSRTGARVARTTVEQALVALAEIVSDIREDIANSNCDSRIKKCADRVFREISRDFDAFRPISFGISVSVLRSFSSAITEEFGEASAAYILATLVQCDTFLQNYDSWREYIKNSQSENLENSGDLTIIFSQIVNHSVFDLDIQGAAKELEGDKKDFGIVNQKIEYSIFQSVSNVISTALREALVYVAGILGKTAKYISESVGRGIGALAVAWATLNYRILIDISEKYEFFRWIKPVVDFVKKYSTP